MKIVNLIAMAAVAAVSVPSATFAKDVIPCSCVTSGPSAGPVGSIVAASGNVLTNGAKDFQPAAAGTPVSVGSEISVGAKSAAQISVGTCGLSLSAGSVTRVMAQEGGNICVSSVQTTNTAYGADALGEQLPEDPQVAAPVVAGTSWVPLGIFTTLAVTAAALPLLSDNDDPVSP